MCGMDTFTLGKPVVSLLTFINTTPAEEIIRSLGCVLFSETENFSALVVVLDVNLSF